MAGRSVCVCFTAAREIFAEEESLHRRKKQREGENVGGEHPKAAANLQRFGQRSSTPPGGTCVCSALASPSQRWGSANRLLNRMPVSFPSVFVSSRRSNWSDSESSIGCLKASKRRALIRDGS